MPSGNPKSFSSIILYIASSGVRIDKNSKKTYCVSFVKTRADDLCDKIPVYHYIGDDYTKTVKRTRLFNINDNNQLDKIVYYNFNIKKIIDFEPKEIKFIGIKYPPKIFIFALCNIYKIIEVNKIKVKQAALLHIATTSE